MPPEFAVLSNQEALIRRYPVVTYFALTFLISLTGCACRGCAASHPRRASAQMTGILMFHTTRREYA
jgi:hypothetical protein